MRYLLASVLLAAATTSAGAAPDQPIAEVFFGSDSAALSAEATAKLGQAATQARQQPDAKIVINGHADPRGTSPYNVALSIRRAEAVRDRLLATGVCRANIVMAYYGEDGPRRATFAQDRRVSIELTRSPLYVIIDQALPTATAVTWSRPATTAEIRGPRPQVARR